MSQIEQFTEQIRLAVADALARFIDLGPSAYGPVDGDSLLVEDLDVTAWFGGRALPATGRVLAATEAMPREALERHEKATIVIGAPRGVVLVYAGSEFVYSVPHPRGAFFDDLLNRQVPQDDPPSRYFGWQ